jgi:hypothetical protein
MTAGGMAFRAEDVKLAREEWRPWVLGLLIAVGTVLFGLALWFSGKGAGLVVLVAFCVAVAWYLWRGPPRRGHAVADRDGLSFEGRKLVGRAQLSSAQVIGSGVRLERGDRPGVIRLEAQSPRDARALVEALELGAAHKAARFPLEGGGLTFGPLVIGVAGAFAVFAGAVSRSAWAPLLLVIGVLVVAGVIVRAVIERPSVSVGVDGILTERYLRRRFIAFREVARVSSRDAEPGYVAGAKSWVYLELALHSGDVVRIPIEQPSGKAELMAPALLHRVREAARVTAREPSNVLDQRAVGRGGQSAGEWLDRLRAFGAAPGYRRGATSDETLWRILDDAHAEASARLGAAVALRFMRRTNHQRLRIATETVADPRLQHALRVAAAAADDAELLAALDELEESGSDGTGARS